MSTTDTSLDAASEKNARLDLRLRADSGYCADEKGHRVSAEQWAAIVSICEDGATGRIVMAALPLLHAAKKARDSLATAVIANAGGMFDHETVGEHEVVAQLDAAIAKATNPQNSAPS